MPDKKLKEQNFIRLAESRTNKIIDMIGLLENLSNKTNYAYTDEQVEKIFSSIEAALAEAKEKFKDDPVPKKRRFRL